MTVGPESQEVNLCQINSISAILAVSHAPEIHHPIFFDQDAPNPLLGLHHMETKWCDTNINILYTL
jgi:hypothetical protein